MPDSVPNAAPTLVFPYLLTKAFTRTSTLEALENKYQNGESQRSLLVNGFRREYQQTQRFNAAQWATFLAFVESVNGVEQPFWFYDLYETVPLFTVDPTGTATHGKYPVRFDNQDLLLKITLGRSDVPIEIIQIS